MSRPQNGVICYWNLNAFRARKCGFHLVDDCLVLKYSLGPRYYRDGMAELWFRKCCFKIPWTRSWGGKKWPLPYEINRIGLQKRSSLIVRKKSFYRGRWHTTEEHVFNLKRGDKKKVLSLLDSWKIPKAKKPWWLLPKEQYESVSQG